MEIKPHGNSFLNKEPHHLYEIWDTINEEVFKYGISDDPLGKDGYSNRIREQLEIYNLAADANRYNAKVLKTNIPGRKAAEKVEVEFILAYENKFGKKPRGNRKKIKRSL